MIKSKHKTEFDRLYYNLLIQIKQGLAGQLTLTWEQVKLQEWYKAKRKLADSFDKALYNNTRASRKPLEEIYYNHVCDKIITFQPHYKEAINKDFEGVIGQVASRIYETLTDFGKDIFKKCRVEGIELVKWNELDFERDYILGVGYKSLLNPYKKKKTKPQLVNFIKPDNTQTFNSKILPYLKRECITVKNQDLAALWLGLYKAGIAINPITTDKQPCYNSWKLEVSENCGTNQSFTSGINKLSTQPLSEKVTKWRVRFENLLAS